MTSDEYLHQLCDTANVFEVKYATKKTLPERMGLAASLGIENAITGWISSANKARFWS